MIRNSPNRVLTFVILAKIAHKEYGPELLCLEQKKWKMAHTITITNESIIDRCKKLSAYEGNETDSGNGESRFADILITKQEEPLILDYISQAVQRTYNILERLIASTSSTEQNNTNALNWTMRDDILWPATKNGALLNKHIEETIVAYVMKCWMDEKRSDRSAFYDGMYNNYIELVLHNAFASEAPKKHRTIYGM